MSIHVIDEDDLIGEAKDVLSEAGKFNFGDYGAPTSERHYPSNIETIRFADELEFRTSEGRNLNPNAALANLPDLKSFHTTDVIYVNTANPILSGLTDKQLRSLVLHEAYHESEAFAKQSSSIVQGMIASGINIPTGSANIKALERQVEEAIIREAVRDIAGINRGISDVQYKTFDALFENYWHGSPLDNDTKDAITRAFHVGRLVEALPSLIDDPLGDSAAEAAARARGNEIYEELLARHGSEFEKYVDEYLTEFIKEFPDAGAETATNAPIPDSEGTAEAVRISQRPTQRPDPTDEPNKSLLDAFKDFFGISPTIFDLDNDGVEISHIGTVSFDWDDDGFKEQSNWVSPDDGFLVLDLAANSPDGSITAGDGKIDQAHELAFALWGANGMTDLQALAQAVDSSGNKIFDTNGDGKLNSLDGHWSSFKIWQDSDQDGVTDSGELKTLDQLDITEINLAYDNGLNYGETSDDVEVFGNTLKGLASFTRNGVTVNGGVGDVELAYDKNGYRETETLFGFQLIAEEDGSVVGSYLELSKSSSPNVTVSSDSYNGVYGDERDNEINARSSNIQMVIDGGAGNDRLDGGAGNDILIGGNGDDTIYAENGNDQLFGGDGNDNLQGRAGDDLIVGGDGADRLYGHTGADQLQGGNGDDLLYGDVGNDTLNGDDGRDKLYGQDGDDRLFGNGQDDYLRGGDGADYFDGGGQNDRLVGDAGADIFHFDITDDQDRILDFEDNIDTIELDGFDAMFGSWEGVKGYVTQNGSDVFFDFGNGDTLLVENATIDQVKDDVVIVGGGAEKTGSYIDNTFTGTGANEAFYGHGGEDVLTGNGGNDFLIGGSGNDRLYGGSGNDLLKGGTGDDYLRDDAGRDHIDGGSGIDALSYHGHVSGVIVDLATGENSDGDVITGIENLYGSDNGADTLRGDAQDNRMFGNAGDDQLEGREGRDKLYGGAGDDRLFGNGQDDYLRGGDGADYFDGGGQNDRLVGDAGADVFHFDITDDQDRILDFEDNIDTIELDGFDALFSSWNGLQNFASQTGADVVFDFGNGDTLTVENATISQLQDDLAIV